MKKDKKSVGSREFDSERETRVLLEEVRKEVHIVAEGHGAIMRKLDEHGCILEEHGRMLGEHGARLGRLENNVSILATDMQCVKAAVLETGQRVRSLEVKVHV